MTDRLRDPWTLVGASLVGLLAVGLFSWWSAWTALLWCTGLGLAAWMLRYSTWASTGARQAIALVVAGVWLFAAILLTFTVIWPGIVAAVGTWGILWAVYEAPPATSPS